MLLEKLNKQLKQNDSKITITFLFRKAGDNKQKYLTGFILIFYFF
jgi:hypothetical protein